MMNRDSPLAAASAADPSPSPSRAPARPFAKAVLLVSAIAGTLDIIAAHFHLWFLTGRFPATLFKTIASGALGREKAMQGGAGVVALGVFFHYFISFAFTLLYFLLFPRLALLRQNVWASGLAYATAIWAVMNLIVLPSSALSAKAPNFANVQTYVGWGILIAAVGLPIALGAARFYQSPQRSSNRTR